MGLALKGAGRRDPSRAGGDRTAIWARGLLLCGAGTSGSWRRVLSFVLTARPSLMEGHLCATCPRAHDEVGELGPTLVEQASLDAPGNLAGGRPRALGAAAGDDRSATRRPVELVSVRSPEPDAAAAGLAAEVAELRAELAALRTGGAT